MTESLLNRASEMLMRKVYVKHNGFGCALAEAVRWLEDSGAAKEHRRSRAGERAGRVRRGRSSGGLAVRGRVIGGLREHVRGWERLLEGAGIWKVE